jgi:hypothetical protein
MAVRAKVVASIINPAIKDTLSVMPDLIRHPVPAWIPAFAGTTTLVVFNRRVNNIIISDQVAPRFIGARQSLAHPSKGA